jgi:hypothetical protein
VFGRRLSHAGHTEHAGHAHPLRRRVLLTILAAAVLAALALLIAPPHAHGNFVYWSEGSPSSAIGRAKINGTGLNNNFITGLNSPVGVATDSKFIYWADTAANKIGRANLDGTGVNQNFITTGVTNPTGIAVTSSAIYWGNGDNTIGHANIDGTGPVGGFISAATSNGLAADSSFLYFLGDLSIGRATLDGTSVDPNFQAVPEPFAGPAVDPSFLYWASDAGNTVGRVPVGGGTPDGNFIAAGTTSGGPSGVAVNSQYVFWGDIDADTIGRANINGNAVNHNLVAGAAITGPTDPSLFAAAPSNKITVNSVTKKKKKGTATINAKVPGPGQVTLNQTNTPPDVNATAAAVKQVALTITQASSFALAVKPIGKTAKKLNKQIKKQLKKKRKAKAKANVTVFIHFVPAGVAGVPNTQQVKVTLIKQRTKKK